MKIVPCHRIQTSQNCPLQQHGRSAYFRCLWVRFVFSLCDHVKRKTINSSYKECHALYSLFKRTLNMYGANTHTRLVPGCAYTLTLLQSLHCWGSPEPSSWSVFIISSDHLDNPRDASQRRCSTHIIKTPEQAAVFVCTWTDTWRLVCECVCVSMSIHGDEFSGNTVA